MRLFSKSEVSDRQLAFFMRQLQVMLEAAVPILRALDYFASSDDTELGQAVSAACNRVRTGQRLSRGFATRPDVFSPVFIGLIKTGEETGSLVRMTYRLADLLERNANLRSRLASSLVYPIFLLSISLLAGLLFIYGVLPSLEPLVATVNVVLPWPTRILIGFGHVLRNRIFLGACVAVLVEARLHGGLLWAKLREQEARRLWLDQFWLRIPLIGMVYRQILISRLMLTLSTSLDVGINLLEALALTEHVVDNSYVVRCLQRIRLEITDGNTLGTSMERCGFFPRWVNLLVQMGEESASLPRCMHNVATINEENADYAIESCSRLLEPMLICGLGLVGGFLIIAAMAPIATILRAL